MFRENLAFSMFMGFYKIHFIRWRSLSFDPEASLHEKQCRATTIFPPSARGRFNIASGSKEKARTLPFGPGIDQTIGLTHLAAWASIDITVAVTVTIVALARLFADIANNRTGNTANGCADGCAANITGNKSADDCAGTCTQCCAFFCLRTAGHGHGEQGKKDDFFHCGSPNVS
jgi:hypothetical protein